MVIDDYNGEIYYPETTKVNTEDYQHMQTRLEELESAISVINDIINSKYTKKEILEELENLVKGL